MITTNAINNNQIFNIVIINTMPIRVIICETVSKTVVRLVKKLFPRTAWLISRIRSWVDESLKRSKSMFMHFLFISLSNLLVSLINRYSLAFASKVLIAFKKKIDAK